MKKVLISKEIHSDGMALLEGRFETVILPDNDPENAKKLIADADGMVLRTNIKIDKSIIEAAQQLKVISRTGVGVDNVDVEAATAKGIMVCNTPGVNANSVAEQAVALILATAKRLTEMDTNVRQGNWKIRNSYKSRDLDGLTLGLVGLGKIGSMVAAKCRSAFNMSVIAYDPYVKEAEGITLYDNLDEIFKQADVVSIHVPYMKETHHLVDDRLIRLMKSDAMLVNTSRGPLVDEKALTEALLEDRLAGAGLDVFEGEPPATDNPLFTAPNVVATPHSSALSRECVRNVAVEAAQAVVDALEERKPRFVFNAKELGL